MCQGEMHGNAVVGREGGSERERERMAEFSAAPLGGVVDRYSGVTVSEGALPASAEEFEAMLKVAVVDDDDDGAMCSW